MSETRGVEKQEIGVVDAKNLGIYESFTGYFIRCYFGSSSTNFLLDDRTVLYTLLRLIFFITTLFMSFGH